MRQTQGAETKKQPLQTQTRTRAAPLNFPPTASTTLGSPPSSVAQPWQGRASAPSNRAEFVALYPAFGLRNLPALGALDDPQALVRMGRKPILTPHQKTEARRRIAKGESFPLTFSDWGDVEGPPPGMQAEFDNVLANLYAVGFVLGGGDSAGHGLYLNSGSATFNALRRTSTGR